MWLALVLLHTSSLMYTLTEMRHRGGADPRVLKDAQRRRRLEHVSVSFIHWMCGEKSSYYLRT